MWGSHGEFVIDGNLASVEYADRLGPIKVPTLITVGDHDECDPSLVPRHARQDSRLEAGRPPEERAHDLRGPAGDVHQAVDEFLNPPEPMIRLAARWNGRLASRRTLAVLV